MKRTIVAALSVACAITLADAGQASVNFFADSVGGIDALPAALLKGAQEAYDVNMKGLDALDRGELDSAASLFSKAWSLVPNYTDARNNIGVVHFRKGNMRQALEIWRSIIESDPQYAVAYYNMGVVDYYEKEYQACVPLLRKAIGINKRFVEAYMMLGRAELALDRKNDAVAHFREAQKVAPDRADAWQYLAYGLFQNRDTSGAIAVLAKHQDDAESLKMLGQMESFRKNYKAASGYFAAAVSRGGDPEDLVALASLQIDGHDCKDALSTLKSYAAKVSVQSADAYLYAGIAYKDCGDMAGARASFEKGLAKYPADAVLRYNLGQMYFHLKMFDQAEAMWNTVSDSLNDPSLYYLRALNARRKGNLALAENYIRSALRRDERPEYLDLLGVLLYAKGDKDGAAGNFKQALRLDPEFRSAQLNLALLSQSKDELEKSALELEKDRAECRSKCQDLALRLSIVYYHMGQPDKAARVLESLPDGEKNDRIFRHLALFYRDLHEWDSAIRTLEKAKTFFVLDQQAEYELAEDYLLAGDNRKAIDAFNELLGKWDENPWRIYYQIGYAYMEMKEFTKAKTALSQSLRKKPDNLAAQGVMAYILNAEGDAAQARTIWEKTLKEDPSNATLLINMGLSFEKDGKYEEALGYYEKAQLVKRDDNAIQINIGNAYGGMDKNREAVKAYTAALNSSKRNLAAYDLFLVSRKTDDQAVASSMLSILASEFPSSPYTLRAQADMSLWKKDTSAALAKLESLAEKDPGDYVALAKIYGSRKLFDKSNACLAKLPSEPFWEKAKNAVMAQNDFLAGNFGRALAEMKVLGDSGFAALYNMAVAAYNAKQYVDVIALGEKIVSKAKGEDRADVCRLVGNAAMGLKQWKKAQEWYQQLEDIKRSDPLVRYNLAVISYNLGSIEESWSYYQKARELDPGLKNEDIEKRYALLHSDKGAILQIMDSVDYWYNAAVSLQDSARDSAAELDYKKILEKNPAYYRAWNNLGAIYSARGELDRAIECYQKSIEKQHDLPEAYANLVNIYIETKNVKEAQRWIIKGLGHNPDSDILKELDVKVKQLAKKRP
jgi:tetratricopeptide (TPR) repeat protein